jgi:hypothetical protein
MLVLNSKVNIDVSKINNDIQERIKKAQTRLDLQVMKDSNYFCPMDTGTLKSSVINFYLEGSGRLVWNTEYAKKQYYQYEDKSIDDNPNASTKWFEVAKSRNMKKWELLANE